MAASNTIPKDIRALSFEEALSELESIVRKLESGEASLEDAITHYERGNQLRRHCEKKLQDAKMKVEQIVQSDDGGLATTPLDTE